MADPTQTPILGPDTASVDQALGWAMRHEPAAGDCAGSAQAGNVAGFLLELEQLTRWFGMDFAVAAAHASAATDGFTSGAWRESLGTLPGAAPDRPSDERPRIASAAEAARVHATYLGAFVTAGLDSGSEEYPNAATALAAAGYRELVPGYDALAQDRLAAGPARVAADLAADGLGADALARHLAGIRGEELPLDEPVVPADAPSLPPNIIWRPTRNCHPRRGGMKPVANVLHITDDDNVNNVINHFLNPESGASATFVIDMDGTVYQMVGLGYAPWTNGIYKDKWGNRCNRTDVPWLREAIAAYERGGPSLNDYCITYEIVGKPYRSPTPAQYEKVFRLIDHFCAVYGMSRHRGHVMRHADFDRCNRWYCPGQHGVFDLATIIRRLGGDPTNMTG